MFMLSLFDNITIISKETIMHSAKIKFEFQFNQIKGDLKTILKIFRSLI